MTRGRLVTFLKDRRTGRLSTITHVVLDGANKTLCGRVGWKGDEGPFGEAREDESDEPGEPCCLRCQKVLDSPGTPAYT